MNKKFIGTAKKIAEINMNIVAENEEEALMILEEFVDNYDVFSISKTQNYELSVDEIDNKNEEKINSHSDEYEINSCNECEYYCPVCHSCMIDE